MKYHGTQKGYFLSWLHQMTWIMETDIEEIASFGINTVRVPVGYWILTGSDAHKGSASKDAQVFAPYSLVFLDMLINDWALKHNVAVLVDLHAHQGSQNGRDHSAAPGRRVVTWSNSPENVQNSIDVATFLAARYKDSPAFLGVDLLNEPETPTNVEVLHGYYKKAYHLIRETGNNCVLVVSPLLTEQNPSSMQDFMRPPEYQNVWHQWHPYFIWGYDGFTENQLFDALGAYNKSIQSWHGNSLLIGEWSLGSPPSAPFQEDQALQVWGEKQRNAYANARAGWTFWSWRHSDDEQNKRSSWSLRGLLRAKLFKID